MAMSNQRPPSPPREPPTTGFEIIDNQYRLEETLSWYRPEDYYPVRIGEVFHGRYQVIGKLGFGSESTVWPCGDLVEHEYVTLKVFTSSNPQAQNEKMVFQHLNTVQSDHPGISFVRTLRDSFEFPGEKRRHACLVHGALSVTLKRLRQLFEKERLDAEFLKPIIYHILLALEYLHAEAKVVHAGMAIKIGVLAAVDLILYSDVQEENIMMSITDKEALHQFEKEEWTEPSIRRIDGNRVIYGSRTVDMPDDFTDFILCDLGCAVFGEHEYSVDAMPDLYRAPEIVLHTAWDEKIDIWSLGLMCWTVLEGEHLFKDRLPSRRGSTTAHIARMVPLLGPPPIDLLKRGAWSDSFFDEAGNFIADVAVATTSLEDELKSLEGEEKTLFLNFFRRTFQWRPEDRVTAGQLLRDPWIRSILV